MWILEYSCRKVADRYQGDMRHVDCRNASAERLISRLQFRVLNRSDEEDIQKRCGWELGSDEVVSKGRTEAPP